MKYLIIKNQNGIRLFYPIKKSTIFFVGINNKNIYINIQTPNCITVGFSVSSLKEIELFMNKIMKFRNNFFQKKLIIIEDFISGLCIYEHQNFNKKKENILFIKIIEKIKILLKKFFIKKIKIKNIEELKKVLNADDVYIKKD